MCPWRRLLALKSRGYVTCPSCPRPAGVSQLWIHGAPAAHTEWERCPPTTELHGSLQKSPSPWRPGRTNKKRREWNNDRWILQHHRGGVGGDAESLPRRRSWMRWWWRWPWLRTSSDGEPWRRRSTWRHYRWTAGLRRAAAGGRGAGNTQRGDVKLNEEQIDLLHSR